MTENRRERLFLFDGMSLAYRAYFALISRPLVNSKGLNTSAIYGFTTSLMKILEDEQPDHIAVVFDTKEPTFRHKRYAPYKATREKMPEDMASQMEMLKKVVEAFAIPIVEVPGFEADDVIGTIAKRAELEAVETFMVTGDKDFMQLVSPLVKIYKPGTKGIDAEVVDEDGVRARFGVEPAQVVDVLALMGDKSDNIPGVPGIGEKTAIDLVQRFGNIDVLYGDLTVIGKPALKEKLEENRELALLSRELVTIDTNVPLPINFHELKASQPLAGRLRELFTELEFKSLLARLPSSGTAAPLTPAPEVRAAEKNITTRPHSYRIVTSVKELRELVKTFLGASSVVIDTETTSRDAMGAELVGISLCAEPHSASYIPVQETQSAGETTAGEANDFFSHRPKRRDFSAGLPLEEVRNALRPLLDGASPRKCGQNIKYDMLVLRNHGFEIGSVPFDTMVASYVLQPEGQHGLDALALEHCNYRTVSYRDLTGSGKNQLHLRDVELERLADYSAEDADLTCELMEKLSRDLKREGMMELCERVEFPLIPVLADMEFTGVALDRAFLGEMAKDLETQIRTLVSAIHGLAGGPFNINSTQQLASVLFDRLKLPTIRRTKTGFSTDISVLETLRRAHPIIEKLLEYRQLSKLKSTYVDALPKLVNTRTGRVHTSFNQTIASTGRLSSSDPNLQNIPARTDLGREVRKAFVAGREGWGILAADYSQIELRIMAHVSEDPGLRMAFERNEDIHASTASRIFGVPQADVTKEMRRQAKTVNFGIMYGLGPYGLASRLDIPQSKAREIITTYFSHYPGVSAYVASTVARTKRDGCVSTLLGRRRFLPEINSRNQNVRQNAERQAINMPIQGTAADMIKLAMINIHRELARGEFAARMILQVHDELVFELPKEEVNEVSAVVEREMKSALPLNVPVEVETGFGSNWLEAH